MSDTESDNGDKKVEIKKSSSSESSGEDEVLLEKTEGDMEIDKVQEKMTEPPPLPRRKRFVPKYEIEGVYRVVLGEETQILVEIVIGQHVNAQHPWKMVSKAKIIENLESVGEYSEFYKIRNQITAYDDDEVLMGYIADDSKDEDEFYICCTPEARDHCKQQSDKFIKRQEKKLEKKVNKKPRPWTSLGSDVEIKELLPVNTRPLMEVEIKSKFPTVYQPDKFKVRDTNSVRDGYVELTPYRQKFNVVFRRRVDAAIQAAPGKIDRSAQTDLKYPKNMWTQSIADALGKVGDFEGGGDAGMSERGGKGDVKRDNESEISEEEIKEPLDEIGLATYRTAMKRMRRTSYIKMINKFTTTKNEELEPIIELNTVMDMYSNDYPNLVAQKIVDIYDSMAFEEYICFTDVRAKDKYVACAEFHPMWTGIVAISYSDGSPGVMRTVSTRQDPIQRAVYGLNPVMIWSHIDSLFPKLYLETTREVKVLSFCPFNENLLVGGCVNGQIVLWDLTNKLEKVESFEVLSETREKYKIAMNAHMGWMKNVQDTAVVPATVMSNLLTSHYAPVSAIKWLSPNFTVSNTGLISKLEDDKSRSLMLFTGSEDGCVLIWNLSVENVQLFETKKVKKSKRVPKRPSALLVDVSPFKILDRNLQPCYKIILGIAGHPQLLPIQCLAMNYPPIKYTYTPRTNGKGRKYFSCEILPQDESEINTILYCGSSHGELRQVTWEGHVFNTGEVVNSEYSNINFSCSIHDGVITAAEKNPFLNYITATVGGKVLAIWADKLKDRPIIWKKRPCRLTDVKWSLYKPSLLFISTAEGDLETWDLLLRSDLPISVQTMSGNMLTGVSLHTLPLAKNIIGVSDGNGSFRMFLNPPIFMIENEAYSARVESMLARELKLMNAFIFWQEEWMRNNPQILLEMKRKEGALLAENEEEKRRLREEEELRLEAEAEARRQQRMRVVGPEERWQNIIQKLIEKTIAVKKRINRAQLIEDEKPLRELEAQRLEKERRMLDIMKNQKTIFNDTVAILFPEAIKKKEKEKKSLFTMDKESLKKEYLDDYKYLKETALRTVKDNPYKAKFSWDATLAEGKERRQCLNAYEDYINLHKGRIEEEAKLTRKPFGKQTPTKKKNKPDNKDDVVDASESEINVE